MKNFEKARESTEYLEFGVKTANLVDCNDQLNIHSETKLRRHFIFFACIASLNHALVYVVTAYASSLLSGSLGGVVNGLAWSLNAVSGLTVATPLARWLGYKYAIILSFVGYTGQIVSFVFSLRYPAHQIPIAVMGSSLAGILR